jgi:hypothetical protein
MSECKKLRLGLFAQLETFSQDSHKLENAMEGNSVSKKSQNQTKAHYEGQVQHTPMHP